VGGGGEDAVAMAVLASAVAKAVVVKAALSISCLDGLGLAAG